MVTVPILFAFSFGRREDERESKSSNMSLYGSLFYEFKDDAGAVRSNFYTLYFTRRLILILSIFFLSSNPIFQVCLFEIFTLTVIDKQNLFICVFKKPFSEGALNYSNMITEILIALILIFFSFSLFDLSESFMESIDIGIMVLINMVVGVQACGSIAIFIKVVRGKFQRRGISRVAGLDSRGMKIIVNFEEQGILQKSPSGAPNNSFMLFQGDAKDSAISKESHP